MQDIVKQMQALAILQDAAEKKAQTAIRISIAASAVAVAAVIIAFVA